jgi:hypothetical protein
MNLISCETNETIRTATIVEAIGSLMAARRDGGAGVIKVNGVACYVDAADDVTSNDDDNDGPWCDGPSWPETDCACGYAEDYDLAEALREDADELRWAAYDDAETFGREVAL